MILTIRIALCIAGAILLCLALFVYEDEEKKIQSRLEDCWIWLDEHRIRSQAGNALFVTRMASIASRLTDLAFGPDLFSTASFLRLGTLSWIIACFVLALGFDMPFGFQKHVVLISIFCTTAFAALVTLLAKRWPLPSLFLWIAGYCCLFALAGTGYGKFDYKVSCGIASGFLLSLATDLAVLSAMRALLRRSAYVNSLAVSCVISTCALILALVAFLGPYFFVIITGHTKDTLDFLIKDDVENNAAYILTFLNASDLFVLLTLFIIVSTFAFQHALWPLLQRPLYALHRHSFLSNKKAIGSLGFTMLSTGIALKTTTWLEPVLKAIKKSVLGD